MSFFKKLFGKRKSKDISELFELVDNEDANMERHLDKLKAAGFDLS